MRTPDQRRRISEGTRAALARCRAEGRRYGQVPFGMRVSTTGSPDRIERCPREQRGIRRVIELADIGLSQRTIARLISDEMPEAVRGSGPMRPALVHAILHRHRSS